MEQFEVYWHDGVFYSQKELENMGLEKCDYEDFQEKVDQKDSLQYKIVSYCGTVESKYSANDYLIQFAKMPFKEVFFKDYQNYGFVLEPEKYYGVSYTNYFLLFKTKEQQQEFLSDVWDAAMDKIKVFDQDMIQLQIKYNNQEQIKIKQKQLHEMIPKE